ncbi:MAG: YdcF family protein, partial [Candidatus Saccharimonadales bacterium]
MSGERTAILAHGKNWEVPVPADPALARPSIESQMTAEAAGVMLTHGVGDMIIFAGGRTAGQEYPSEAEAMLRTMRGHFGEEEVPDEAVRLEDQSPSTAAQLSIVKDLLPEYGADNVILLTVGYHMPRVIWQARREGVPVRGFARSDYVIRGRHGDASHLYARNVLAQTMGQSPWSWRPGLRAATAYGME